MLTDSRGRRLEREIARKFEAAGFAVKRERLDLRVEGVGAVKCKRRREKFNLIYEWVNEPGVDAVVFRSDGRQPVVVMTMDQLLLICKKLNVEK